MLSLFHQTFSKQTAFNQTLPQKFAKKTLRAFSLSALLGIMMLSPTSMADNAYYKNAKYQNAEDIKTSLINDGIAPQTVEGIMAKTEIAVSNYPLWLLSEAVTKNAPSAKLLLDAGDIGHHGSLSPSDMKTVQDSRYVVWFGEALETNLEQTLTNAPNAISLYDFDAFNRLPFRDVQAKPIDDTLDPHIWLDPDNAKAIVRALGVLHARANPKYAETYLQNVQEFEQQMNEAVANVQASASVQNATPASRPYWAYHDAFAYLEPTLKLNLLGSLTIDHHLPPKASQFRWLQGTRPTGQTMCMVLQTDSNQKVVDKLKPLRTSTHSEDMSNFNDFITSWQTIARQINECVR